MPYLSSIYKYYKHYEMLDVWLNYVSVNAAFLNKINSYYAMTYSWPNFLFTKLLIKSKLTPEQKTFQNSWVYIYIYRLAIFMKAIRIQHFNIVRNKQNNLVWIYFKWFEQTFESANLTLIFHIRFLMISY